MSDEREDGSSDGGEDQPVPGDRPDPAFAEGFAPFARVREVLTGQPTLDVEALAEQAGLPTQIAVEILEAMDWADRPAYDERDVSYLRDVATMLDHYPLESLVRTIRTRNRAISSIVVSDLGTVRDRVVMPALAGGAQPDELADQLGRTAEVLVPLVARNLAEDYRHILLKLLDTDALARGVGGDRELDLAVGFVDVSGYTALSGRVDPAGLDHVLSGFEDLVNGVVSEAEGVLLAKFIGDAAMLVASDIGELVPVLLRLVEDRERLAEAPRKAGVAAGPVLVRSGDYYGPTPNLAARLTEHARPWTLLAAADLGERIDDAFELTRIPETKLRGVGDHRPLRVRARSD